jgi:hypothetical protein
MLTGSKTQASSMSPAESNARWKSLYRIGAAAALVGVALIPVQIIIFVVWPPPTTVTDWFTLFQDNWLLGLLSLDLLYILNKRGSKRALNPSRARPARRRERTPPLLTRCGSPADRAAPRKLL